MKRLMKYLMKYWKIAFLSPLLMLTEVMIDLFQPMLMKTIIDDGISGMDLDIVKTYAGYMIILSLVGWVSASISGLIAVYSSQSAGADLRDDLFKKVQTLSFKDLDTLKTGSMITRLTNDVVQIQQFFQQLLRIMVRAPFMLIGSTVLTFYVSVKYGSILLSLMAILLVVVYLVIKQAQPLFKKSQKQVDAVNNVMLENIKGIRVIKAFVRKDHENDRFEKENNGLMTVQMKATRKFSVVMPMIMLTVNLAIVVILWFGSFDIVEGTTTVGEIVALVNYITRLLFGLMMVGMIFFRVSKASASADRINEIFDIKDHADDKSINHTIDGSVEFKHVSFKYNTDSTDCVLEDINFKINKGETLAIIGATGSGKSTLLQLIPRFYDASSGSILIDGQDISTYSKESLRKHIAYVQQHAFIFSGTIASNVAFDDDLNHQIIEDAQANNIVKSKDGVETEIKQRGSNLSGGQKQRLSIARGLNIKPNILILDDATSALDAKTEFELKKALKKNYENTTIIMVAQRISSVMQADHILVIDEGKIVASGKHEDLMATQTIYKDIYDSQLGKVIS